MPDRRSNKKPAYKQAFCLIFYCYYFKAIQVLPSGKTTYFEKQGLFERRTNLPGQKIAKS
jgi:hypothetical protein